MSFVVLGVVGFITGCAGSTGAPLRFGGMAGRVPAAGGGVSCVVVVGSVVGAWLACAMQTQLLLKVVGAGERGSVLDKMCEGGVVDVRVLMQGSLEEGGGDGG